MTGRVREQRPYWPWKERRGQREVESYRQLYTIERWTTLTLESIVIMRDMCECVKLQ